MSASTCSPVFIITPPLSKLFNYSCCIVSIVWISSFLLVTFVVVGILPILLLLLMYIQATGRTWMLMTMIESQWNTYSSHFLLSFLAFLNKEISNLLLFFRYRGCFFLTDSSDVFESWVDPVLAYRLPSNADDRAFLLFEMKRRDSPLFDPE